MGCIFLPSFLPSLRIATTGFNIDFSFRKKVVLIGSDTLMRTHFLMPRGSSFPRIGESVLNREELNDVNGFSKTFSHSSSI